MKYRKVWSHICEDYALTSRYIFVYGSSKRGFIWYSVGTTQRKCRVNLKRQVVDQIKGAYRATGKCRDGVPQSWCGES